MTEKKTKKENSCNKLNTYFKISRSSSFISKNQFEYRQTKTMKIKAKLMCLPYVLDE